MSAILEHPGSALIVFLIVAGVAWFLGYLAAGGYEYRWDKTICLLMRGRKSPFESKEGPYLPGIIDLQSPEVIQGFRLPYTRSGTMPTIKSIWWHYKEPGRAGTPVTIVSMTSGHLCTDCMFSGKILLSIEPGSRLLITIWNPDDCKEVVFVVYAPVEKLDVKG